MSLVVDTLLLFASTICVMIFFLFYLFDRFRCNPRFNGQMHCISGIIVCNQPLFGLLMHFVGGMILLAAGLKIENDKEISLFMLSALYVSLSGVVSFNVKHHKRIHLPCVVCVAVFGLAFVWLQCGAVSGIVSSSITAAFALVILVNISYMGWVWPWMDLQAAMEIAWALGLLISIIIFVLTPGVNPTSSAHPQIDSGANISVK